MSDPDRDAMSWKPANAGQTKKEGAGGWGGLGIWVSGFDGLRKSVNSIVVWVVILLMLQKSGDHQLIW